MADYHDLIYFKDLQNLYVNLYTPSRVEWNCQGSAVVVHQQTLFPETANVELTVSLAKPLTFGLKLRVPGWLSGTMGATVNGKPCDIKTDQRRWALFEREWRDGDKLVVTLPMAFGVSHLDPAQPYPAAITYGPLTMAVRSPQGNPAGKIDLEQLNRDLIRKQGETLTFQLITDPDILVRPFYVFKEGEPYYMYLNQ